MSKGCIEDELKQNSKFPQGPAGGVLIGYLGGEGHRVNTCHGLGHLYPASNAETFRPTQVPQNQSINENATTIKVTSMVLLLTILCHPFKVINQHVIELSWDYAFPREK